MASERKTAHKMVNWLVVASKYCGLWAEKPSGEPFFRHNYMIPVGISLNICDSIFKFLCFLKIAVTDTFESFNYLEVARNILAKCILVVHWTQLFRKRDDFWCIVDFLKFEKEEDILKKFFLLDIIFLFYKVVTLLMLDIPRGNYVDLAETFTFVLNNHEEFIIMMQFCSFLDVVKRNLVVLGLKVNAMHFKFVNFDQHLEICKKIMDFYGLQILLMIGQIFLILLSYIYGQVLAVICILQGKCGSQHTVYWVQWNSANVLHGLLALTLVIHVPESTKNAIGAFHKALFKITRKHGYLLDNNQVKLYLMTKPTVEFSALSFFSLKYSLITSIFAGLTTYLVLIFQFQEIDAKSRYTHTY